MKLKDLIIKEAEETEISKKVSDLVKKIEDHTKKNDQNEWIIISCWQDPPLPGTRDYHKKQQWLKYKKAGFFGKLFITLKRQLGL